MDKLREIPIIYLIQNSNSIFFFYVDVNLMGLRPSVIALAATLMVTFDATLTREIMDLQIGEILLQLNLDTVSFLSNSLSGFCFFYAIINKHNFIMFFILYSTQEAVFCCYHLMKEKSIEKGKLNSPDSTLTSQWSYTSVLDHSVSSSVARRKLGFDNKENCPRQRSHWS